MESTKGRSTVQPTGNAAEAATISPLLFLLSLLLGAGLSYYAGTMYKNHWITAPDAHRGFSEHASLSKREKLLEAARYQRGMINVVPSTSTCENECPATQELTIEQVFFAKEGYSQYDEDDDDDEEDDEDDDHYVQFYAAQLIMDVQRLDSDFLMDASRIRQAMFETIWEASEDRDLAISSVHCQKSIGVTCVAVLADGNHMTVSTNPEHHFCTLDLYFADDRHLLEVVPILEKNFGVGQKSRARFRHLFRGQRTALLEGFTWSAFEQDLTDELLDIKDQFFYKKEIATTQTDFQEIHVWEGLKTTLQSVEGYEKSLETGVDNYFTQHPELFYPNRLLFMDGVMQSTTRGDEAYHEALVHPAMFANAEGPKRAAIIGGGEGATLREVLRHKSIEVCMMIEIDPGIVQASRDSLPSMNDCSDFGAGNCFDEERTDLRLEDAFGWFLNRFKTEGEVPDELKTDPFDIIVIDALDPEDNVEFAVHLYGDEHFWGTLHEALTEKGILVVQLGMTPRSKASEEQFATFRNRANLFKTIEAVGFNKTFIYHDTHGDFKYPWSYLAACKSEDCSKEWHRNEAEVNLRVRERILPTKSGKPSLQYFDGATMQEYQRPYKTWETAHCRKVPEPEECRIYRNAKSATSWSDAFDHLSENGETKLVAKMDLPKGSVVYRTRNDIVSTPSLPLDDNVLKQFAEVANYLDSNSTCNGVVQKLADLNLNDGKISPLRRRQPHLFDMDVLNRDIMKGEQLSC